MIKQTDFLIPLVWATAVVTLTGIETKPVLRLSLLGLFVVIFGLQGMFRKKAWRRYPVAVLVVLMFLAASLASFIRLALWLFAPSAPHGHPVMPIGQALGGIVAGSLFWVLVSWLYFTRLKPDLRTESLWAYGSFTVLGIAFTVDCLL